MCSWAAKVTGRSGSATCTSCGQTCGISVWRARGERAVSETDLADVWARSLDGLADLQIKPHQRAWLKLTRPLGLVENTALIATPNEFVKEQLETRLRALVTHALSAELGRSIQLAVTVDPASAAGPAAAEFGSADYAPPSYGEPAEDPVRSFSDTPARNFVTAPAPGDFERLAPGGPGSGSGGPGGARAPPRAHP